MAVSQAGGRDLYPLPFPTGVNREDLIKAAAAISVEETCGIRAVKSL